MTARCGAKTRSGEPCQRWGSEKNGRCRLHGGASTGPVGYTNAATHGIYRQHLTDSEREQYGALELGHVDHELRLARIRLARALAAENAAQGQPEIDEITENDGAGEYVARVSKKSKVRDYSSIIDRLTARIESLERTRKQLDAGDGGNDDIAGFETVPYES